MKILVLYFAIIGPMGPVGNPYFERFEVEAAVCDKAVKSESAPIGNMPPGWFAVDVAWCE